jgi:NADH-quinone oxidoreductase subunit L
MNLVWIILFAPLAAALAIALATRKSPALSAALSVGAILLGFGLSLKLFLDFEHGAVASPTPVVWLDVAGFRVEWGAVLDRLSILMLLVVTGVGSAIHVFSIGYMKGDTGYARYFACLSLFTFSMLGVVLATNFVQLFLFWELVGLSSYLLIGFWFERPSAAEAAKKALLTNRVGDFGFMLGILLVFALTGSVDFAAAQQAWPPSNLTTAVAALAGLLVFCGAVGKSAQVPLHVWLPDAMEGPTPVSALIHAATMVAAGVYMMCRLAWLIAASPIAMEVVAWTGGITALLAALIAVTQNDIKRVLAYSTLSQLGYMMMSVGLGGTTQSMFHLTTHAFFKALLFLSAGSVIHALHHEQDIWKMGGLAKKLPVTFLSFLIGTLALGGIWPMSGFYSKDEILVLAMERNPSLFWIGAVTAFLTAFYMGRALFVAFLGRPRDAQTHAHAHESPAVMLLPLILLSALSIVGGWGHAIPHFLMPDAVAPHHGMDVVLKLIAFPVAGFIAALALYAKASASDRPLTALGPLYRVLSNKFYFDELYAALIKYVQGGLATACDLADRWIIQGLGVRGLAGGASLSGRLVKLMQSGHVNLYAFVFGLGAALILFLAVLR